MLPWAWNALGHPSRHVNLKWNLWQVDPHTVSSFLPKTRLYLSLFTRSPLISYLTECFHLKALPFTFLPSSRLCTFNYPLFHQNLPFSLSSIFLLCCFHFLSLYRHTGLILSERKGNVYFIQPFPLVLVTTYPLPALFHMQWLRGISCPSVSHKFSWFLPLSYHWHRILGIYQRPISSLPK